MKDVKKIVADVTVAASRETVVKRTIVKIILGNFSLNQTNGGKKFLSIEHRSVKLEKKDIKSL